MARLTFHGGAGTVTGSKYLLEALTGRVLIDCGLFQGHKKLRARNWTPPPFPPKSLDAVVLTHAHIDHSGYLPRLVREGFRGPVYATPATADLADLLLRDSARIQEEDAEYANKKGFSRHTPALPLYTEDDAKRAISQIEVVDFGQWTEVGTSLRFRHRPAGHILGSGMIAVDLLDREEPRRAIFSGDVGRYDAPLVADPETPEPCDVLVVESTYGDRTHPVTPIGEQLEALLRRTIERESVLLVPSFAVGRAQQLVYLLHEVMERKSELSIPIHLDSPMAVDTTKIYKKYPEEAGLEDIRMRPGSSPLFDRSVFLHRTRDESVRLNSLSGPRVIISSSGMMTGGRILHHLRRRLPNADNTVVLAGYQAPGTRGWRLQRGEKRVRIHGEDVPVNAQLSQISGLSAHADSDQLVRWMRPLPPPRITFVTHGDPEAAEALARRLEAELDFRCETPGLGDSFEV